MAADLAASLAAAARTGAEAAFARDLTALTGCPSVHLTASGRAAFFLILEAGKRLRPDRCEVVLPAYTCPVLAYATCAAGLRVRLVDDAELTPFQAAVLAGAVAAGVPRVADLNDPDDVAGVAASPVNIWQGQRWNSALAYLDPVRTRPNLTVAGEALVERVEIERGRAVAVWVASGGATRRIAANRIVLAAGAYESPAILLRSGIFVEYPPQTRIEGEIQQLDPDHPVTELWQVIAGTVTGRSDARQITLFDQQNFQAAPGGIARDADPVDTAADDRNVVIGAAGRVRWQRLGLWHFQQNVIGHAAVYF